MQEQLVRLEEKITFLENYLEQLDDAVKRLGDRLEHQNKSVARLESAHDELRESLSDSGAVGGSEDDLAGDRPPHW